MLGEENKTTTTDTNSPVPFIVTDSKLKLTDGALTGVAPTILKYMDISIPESMRESKILIKD
jgi:bisphosphoglycerate-independent phosphoglycerate mutase (AlkP superfamily)